MREPSVARSSDAAAVAAVDRVPAERDPKRDAVNRIRHVSEMMSMFDDASAYVRQTERKSAAVV